MNARENRTPTANTNSTNFVAAKAKSCVRCRLIISLILPFNPQNREHLLHIYLGHEFEFHFIRLEPIVGMQSDVFNSAVNVQNVNIHVTCIQNKNIISNHNITDNSSDFCNHSFQEVIQPTNYSTDFVLNLHLSTDDSSFSLQSSHLDSAPCYTEGKHIDAPLLSALDSSASPKAVSDRNELNTTDHDGLSPPSLNMSFYIDPPSLI